MRVLLFYYAEFALGGGLETVVLSLAKGFCRSGYQTGILEMGPQWESQHSFSGVPLWTIAAPSLPTYLRPRSWAAFARSVWQFREESL